jgi:hypothetical protein
MGPHPFSIREKFRISTSMRKIMATVLWDRKAPLLIDILHCGGTINAAAYCETLKSYI